MPAHRPLVYGVICHFSLASAVLIDCLAASIRNGTTDARESATFFSPHVFFRPGRLEDSRKRAVRPILSTLPSYLSLRLSGRRVFFPPGILSGRFLPSTAYPLGDHWTVAGRKVEETSEHLTEVNNLKLQSLIYIYKNIYKKQTEIKLKSVQLDATEEFPSCCIC